MRPGLYERSPPCSVNAVKLLVDPIGPEGLALAQPLPVDWLNAQLTLSFWAQRPGHLSGRLSRVERTVELRGELHADLCGPCSRCLEDVPCAVQVPLQLTFVPASEAPKPADDGELQEADLGVIPYVGREVDLQPVLHDELLLQLPMKVLCRSDCAGLCAECGANRNDVACGCADEAASDPRLRPLRQLLDPSKPSF